MAENAEWAMHLLKRYAIQYTKLKREGRKTHMKAKMIRRKMEIIEGWLRSIEFQLKEDEQL